MNKGIAQQIVQITSYLFFEEIKIELVESEEENTDTMELKDIEK